MNTLLFETLEKIRPIQSAFVSTHNTDDKYARIFRLIFRFKETPKDDQLYKKLISIINNFSKNTDWVIATSENSKNYIITPEYFYKNHILNNTELGVINNLDKDIIDKAIKDLPFLVQEIKKGFNLA